MTETSPLFTVSAVRQHLADISEEERVAMKAKAGHAMVGSRVRVVNEHGEDVEANGQEVGEIILRGHGVMQGYWKNEEETLKTIKDGWLYTGDMGTIDENQTIDIVDRKKDVIISGGENISSIEVEGVLYDHPAVLEAAVIAVPHERWGETPHAFVVTRGGQTLTEEELITFCRSKMAHFKSITSVTFVDELPKTASGKIQKIHLRDEYWQSQGKEAKFIN